MKVKTIYEEEILKELHDLSKPFQKKMVKIVRLLKQESVRYTQKEKVATDESLRVCGKWEDERTVKEQMKDIYSSRKSTSRTAKAF
jgi:hypothetical protein